MTSTRTNIFLLFFYSLWQTSVCLGQATDKNQVELRLEAYIEAIKIEQRSLKRHAMDSITDLILGIPNIEQYPEYLHLAYYYKCDGLSRTVPAEALEYCEKSLPYFVDQNDNFQLSRIYNVIANTLSNVGDFDLATKNYQKAVDYSSLYADDTNLDELQFRSRIRYNEGFTLTRGGKMAEASQIFYSVLDVANLLGDSLVQLSVLNQLGNIELMRDNASESLLLYREALKVAKLFNPSFVYHPIIGIASAHQEMHELDSALYYYDQILDGAKKRNDVSSVCVILYNLSEVYLEQNRLREARITATELEELASNAGMRQHIANAYLSLMRCGFEEGRYEEALDYSKKAQAELDPESDFSITVNIYKYASQIYEIQGNYSEALKCERLHKRYSDSLLNKQALATIEDLRIAHESSTKDLKILELENKNKLATLEFKQRLGIFSAILLGSILLSTIIYLYFNRRKLALQKQKENIEGRLLRSQMNPHFIFNAISSIQNYFFDKADLKLGLSYMSKFAQLMRQILEHSREEYVTLENEIDSLNNYLEIQQLRYSNSFGYEVNVDDDLETGEILVPPLIAQPFVENAIEHGMIYRIENGSVKITFENKQDIILLSIEDNGVAGRQIEIKPRPRMKKGKSLSTKITRERLEHLSTLHKKRFELVAKTLSTGGMLVNIELPKKLIK